MSIGFIKKSLLGLAVFYAICLLVSIWTNFINPEIMAKIRYANRKSNTARKLHQEVLTLAYGKEKKPNDVSNNFLNESNYYWDIVQGKKPEKVKGYSNRIKTEEQYISWLERKRDEYKGVIP